MPNASACIAFRAVGAAERVHRGRYLVFVPRRGRGWEVVLHHALVTLPVPRCGRGWEDVGVDHPRTLLVPRRVRGSEEQRHLRRRRVPRRGRGWREIYALGQSDCVPRLVRG